MEGQKVGSVLVVGGGIAGMQSAIDLAESGFKVYLVEESPSIGGRMSQLDKTFPTTDCAMCNLAPKMVAVAGHPNIELMTYSEVIATQGEAGRFTVTIREKARSIDPEKCTGCGECTLHCPVRYQSYYPELGAPAPGAAREEVEKIDLIINRYVHLRAPLIPILQAVNDMFGFLPENVLLYLSHRLETPLANMLRIATFYAMFSLKPRGKQVISICQGTSCFVRGGDRVLERFKDVLGIDAGDTTPDRQYSLDVVRCLGCCALAPVVKIGGQVHNGVRPKDVEKLVGEFAGAK
jgi:NADH:ubiquinone oxidoreductase subunit E/NAD-dependent dihydropyrimidine dehydrogenase PreA subunit